jgi:hypothetical protein
MKARLTLLQVAATLYKYCSHCPENKRTVIKLKLQEELCEAAFMCEGAPRVLSYVGWIIDSLYRDMLAYGTVEDLGAEEVSSLLCLCSAW